MTHSQINHAEAWVLVLPNLLAIKKLRDYCQEIIKKYPKYFEKVGEPINKERRIKNART